MVICYTYTSNGTDATNSLHVWCKGFFMELLWLDCLVFLAAQAHSIQPGAKQLLNELARNWMRIVLSIASGWDLLGQMHAYALVVLESVLVLTSAEKIIQAFETDPSSWWQLYQSFSFIALYFEHVHKSEFSYVFNPSHCQPTPWLFLSLELQCSLSLSTCRGI